jgi:23S rRNA pseudouridine1911/1915/1917 synthase
MKNTINSTITIPEHLHGIRLDKAVAELFPDYSRARLQNWIKDGQLLVNNKQKRPRDPVVSGEVVTLSADLPSQELWQAQAIKLDVIYEDDSILVINKPIGLVVHPAAGNFDQTLVNALLYHCPALNQIPRAGVVHRLDKNTSGLLVVAKTIHAHTQLVRQLQKHTMHREYEAVVTGILIAGGTVEAPIGRHPMQRKKMCVIELGKPAITHYRVAERFRSFTRLKVKLETGRTHQIRVHMAYIHKPIVGDKTYGGHLKLPKHASAELIAMLRNFKHQALHAGELGLIHPESKEYMQWQAPVPEDMKQLIAVLRKECKLD